MHQIIAKYNKLLHKAVTTKEFKFDNILYEFGLEIRTLIPERIHICKRSAGWYICFDHNWGKYYQPNRKSLEQFLKTPQWIIADEYGSEYTFKEFWKMVDDWNSSDIPLFDDKSYSEYEKEKTGYYYTYLCINDIDKVRHKFGIITNSNDFTIDGLRFAVFSDFS